MIGTPPYIFLRDKYPSAVPSGYAPEPSVHRCDPGARDWRINGNRCWDDGDRTRRKRIRPHPAPFPCNPSRPGSSLARRRQSRIAPAVGSLSNPKTRRRPRALTPGFWFVTYPIAVSHTRNGVRLLSRIVPAVTVPQHVEYEAGFISSVKLVPIPSIWGHIAGLGINPKNGDYPVSQCIN